MDGRKNERRRRRRRRRDAGRDLCSGPGDAGPLAEPAAGSACGQPRHAPAAAAAAPTPTPDLQIVFNIGAQTDYSFRGISQTNQRASAFGGADLTYKGQYYAGVWTSNVDFTGNSSAGPDEEVDVYAGWRPTFQGYNLDFGVQYYGYVNQPAPGGIDYTEVYAKGSRSIGPLTLGLSYYYGFNYGGTAKDGYYVEGNGAYTINPKWTVSGAVGYQKQTDAFYGGKKQDFDYTTWNLGVTYAITDKIALDVRYWDTDDHKKIESFMGLSGVGDARVIAGVKATFP